MFWPSLCSSHLVMENVLVTSDGAHKIITFFLLLLTLVCYDLSTNMVSILFYHITVHPLTGFDTDGQR